MSRINTKYRRKLAIETFKGRGRRSVPVNDCQRPSRGEGTRADHLELHAEKMKHKRLRTNIVGFVSSPRKRARLSDLIGKAPQHFEPLPNGGYRTYHPTKGWRIVSPKRLRHFPGQVA